MLYWENGVSNKKKEGDKKTPKGLFNIEHLYYRADKFIILKQI